MSEAVNSSSRYSSSRRQAQAAATRREIVAAAQRLFIANGYVGTTLADIAREAGVAVPTVKLIYRTKRGVLLATWDHSVKGGDDPAPVADQPWFKELVASADPRDHLRLQAAASRHVKPRIGPLVEVIRSAAASDADIAALWGQMQTEFYENQRTTIRALRAKGRLRSGLDETDATDLLWTLNHPAVYQLLVMERAWSPERYERWLAGTLIEQLLDTQAGA
jgi:AcrR family transcriptional regulator